MSGQCRAWAGARELRSLLDKPLRASRLATGKLANGIDLLAEAGNGSAGSFASLVVLKCSLSVYLGSNRECSDGNVHLHNGRSKWLISLLGPQQDRRKLVQQGRETTYTWMSDEPCSTSTCFPSISSWMSLRAGLVDENALAEAALKLEAARRCRAARSPANGMAEAQVVQVLSVCASGCGLLRRLGRQKDCSWLLQEEAKQAKVRSQRRSLGK